MIPLTAGLPTTLRPYASLPSQTNVNTLLGVGGSFSLNLRPATCKSGMLLTKSHEKMSHVNNIWKIVNIYIAICIKNTSEIISFLEIEMKSMGKELYFVYFLSDENQSIN